MEEHESVLSEKGPGLLIGFDETCFRQARWSHWGFCCPDNRSSHENKRAVQMLPGSGMDIGDPVWHNATYYW